MVGLIGVAAMLTVLALSLIITRLATVALTMTGLSYQAARFQARSAFTGTGFTTAEAESVVEHPVRRQIIMLLMIVRSAGVISIIISLILSFLSPGSGGDKLIRLGYLIGGVAVLWGIAQSRWIDRHMKRLIEKVLRHWTDLDTRDYAALLKLAGPYTVMEVQIQKGDWLAHRPLQDCQLGDEGVVVLGIYRDDGSYLGAPGAETEVEAGDTLILYGRADALRNLDQRRAGAAGEQAHAEAVHEQKREVARQEESESRRRRRVEQDRSTSA